MKIHRLGSFQRTPGTLLFESNAPLEEVWEQIALQGSDEFLHKTFTLTAGGDVKPYIEYASVRFRQSIEFRKAYLQSTLLTSPLALYYSFLNLLRASLCMHSDFFPAQSHGLSFQPGASLFDSGAKVARKGTFKDYLDETGYSSDPTKVITLEAAMSRIIEIRGDFEQVNDSSSLVTPIFVDSFNDGDTQLIFRKSGYDLSQNAHKWTSDFPSLAACCRPDSGQNTLNIVYPLADTSDVSDFCYMRLNYELSLNDEYSRWYLIREIDPALIFPRPAYYFILLFILGSIVRYQPELMLDAVDPKSSTGWLLRRVVLAAERAFPQLIFSWLVGTPVYF